MITRDKTIGFLLVGYEKRWNIQDKKTRLESKKMEANSK